MVEEIKDDKKTRAVQVVEGLLAKPSKKPDFTSFTSSSVLQNVRTFLPEFITSTDKLLSTGAGQMDIDIMDLQELNPSLEKFSEKPSADTAGMVSMVSLL